MLRSTCTPFSKGKYAEAQRGESKTQAGPRHIASVRSMESHSGLFYSGDTSLDLQIFIFQKKLLYTWFQECVAPPPLQLVVLLAFWALA